MILPSCASRHQADAGKNRAVVCSSPPSVVGTGIFTSSSLPPLSGVSEDVGKKYRYICVVNLFGTFVGVTHRVKGTKPSVSARPPFCANHFVKGTLFPCTSFLPSSLSSSGTSINLPNPLFLASNIPLSSNVSRTAAMRYTSLSSCLSSASGSGGSPS